MGVERNPICCDRRTSPPSRSGVFERFRRSIPGCCVRIGNEQLGWVSLSPEAAHVRTRLRLVEHEEIGTIRRHETIVGLNIPFEPSGALPAPLPAFCTSGAGHRQHEQRRRQRRFDQFRFAAGDEAIDDGSRVTRWRRRVFSERSIALPSTTNGEAFLAPLDTKSRSSVELEHGARSRPRSFRRAGWPRGSARRADRRRFKGAGQCGCDVEKQSGTRDVGHRPDRRSRVVSRRICRWR